MFYIIEEYVSSNYDIIDAPLVLNKLRKEVTIVTVEEGILYGVVLSTTDLMVQPVLQCMGSVL